MIQLVYDILSTLGIPVKWMVRPDLSENNIGISYHFFDEGYDLYSDGKGSKPGGSLQVDVFSKSDYTETVNQIVELLENSGFKLADKRDSEDSLTGDIKYYQKVLIFNYNERMVQDGSKN